MLHPGSPFHIKAASVTLRNVHGEEVAELLAQHSAETGQAFSAEATAEMVRVTDGQPFLVNALADTCVTHLARDRAQPVTLAQVEAARERLILSRTTHLDSLAERPKEPCVAQVVQSVILGEARPGGHRCISTCLRPGPDPLRLWRRRGGHAMYREVLARQLSLNIQANLSAPWWPWSTAEGGLDMLALLEAFRGWWREKADNLVEQHPFYTEALPPSPSVHFSIAWSTEVVGYTGTSPRAAAPWTSSSNTAVSAMSSRSSASAAATPERPCCDAAPSSSPATSTPSV
jgi:hypothetical protein